MAFPVNRYQSPFAVARIAECRIRGVQRRRSRSSLRAALTPSSEDAVARASANRHQDVGGPSQRPLASQSRSVAYAGLLESSMSLHGLPFGVFYLTSRTEQFWWRARNHR